jgi:hypothetical protein
MRFKPVEPGAPRFALRLAMNGRSFRWFAHLFDAAGRPVAQSVGLVSGACILTPFRAWAALPPGQLYVYDTTGAGEAPRGFGAWRERWALRYRVAADVSSTAVPRVV